MTYPVTVETSTFANGVEVEKETFQYLVSEHYAGTYTAIITIKGYCFVSFVSFEYLYILNIFISKYLSLFLTIMITFSYSQEGRHLSI